LSRRSRSRDSKCDCSTEVWPTDARLLFMEPIRTDFKGYEGKFVALDSRTGEIVIADEDLKVVFEKAKNRKHTIVGGRVPFADEPMTVGLG